MVQRLGFRRNQRKPRGSWSGVKTLWLRHLQAVARDHSPTRFHREDQRQALSKEMQEEAQQMFFGVLEMQDFFFFLEGFGEGG